MVQTAILLEASLDKLRNMGVPAEIADYIHRQMPTGCEEQSFWFAQQFQKMFHQWDEYINEYKQAEKTIKGIVKTVRKKYEESGKDWEGPRAELVQANFKGDPSDLDIAKYVISQLNNAEYDLMLANAEKTKELSLNNLKRVLSPVWDQVELICKWAAEAKINLSKKKTIDVTVEEGGRETIKKVPFDMAVAERLAGKHFGIQQGEVFMEFPNGWFWLDRKTNYCSIEAKLMQHCGRTDNNNSTLWSLRDDRGMPHVTAEIKTDDNGRSIYQMKGKQNDSPDEKYWPFIFALLSHPKFNLYRYFAYGKYGGDLTWDDIPEEQKQKIRDANPDFEEKSEDEARAESAEGRYDALIEALNQADREVDLDHWSSDYEVNQDDYYEGEDVSFSITASLTMSIAIDGLDLRRISNRNWDNELGEYLDSIGISSPSYNWNSSDNVNFNSSYRRYGSDDTINISIFEYEELYDEYSYKSILEGYKSWEQNHYEEFVNAVERFMAMIGAIDFSENQTDFGFLKTIIDTLVDDPEIEGFYSLSSNNSDMVEAEATISIATDHPVNTIRAFLDQQLTDKLIEKGLMSQSLANGEATRFSVKSSRGAEKIDLAIAFNFAIGDEVEIDISDMNDEEIEDEAQIERLEFAKWVAYHTDELADILRELATPHLKNPYDLNQVPEDSTHIIQALQHHKMIPPGITSSYRSSKEYVVFTSHDTSRPQFWILLDLVYGPEASEYPGYEVMKGENFWWSIAIPGEPQDHTIGEWGQLINGALHDYELVKKYAEKKYNRKLNNKWEAERLLNDIDWNEILGRGQQQESIRSIIRNLIL